MNSIRQTGGRGGQRGGWHTVLANIPLAAVSVLLALLLWIAVTNEENPTLRRDLPFDVPVQEVNVPPSFVVSGANPQKVSVTLIGPRGSVTGVRPADLSARVDLSGALGSSIPLDGPLRISARTEVSARARGVRAEAIPASIDVTLEPEVRRVVPVHANQLDALPVGFELSEPLSVQPAEATIAGAKANVDLVQALVADVKLAGLTVNASENVPLEPRDGAGHPIGHVAVQPAAAAVAVKVHQVVYTRQILVDPRVRGRPAAGYAAGTALAEPTTVSVAGSLDALSQVSSLPTQEVDVEGAASDVVRTVPVQLPPGLSQTDSKNSVVVRVPVQIQSGPGSLGVTPRFTGLASGLSVTGQTPTVVVNVTGALPTVLRLSASDVAVTVDVAGLGPGTYRLEPKVSLPSSLQLESVVPDRVALTIIGVNGTR